MLARSISKFLTQNALGHSIPVVELALVKLCQQLVALQQTNQSVPPEALRLRSLNNSLSDVLCLLYMFLALEEVIRAPHCHCVARKEGSSLPVHSLIHEPLEKKQL